MIGPITTDDRVTWRVGQRVSRRDSEELGTVTAINGKIKARWDRGRTSYFRHGDRGNIKLEPRPTNPE